MAKQGHPTKVTMTKLTLVRPPTAKEALALAEMLTYFYTRWQRRRWKKNLDTLEPLPITKLKNIFTGKYHRIYMKAAIHVFFSLHTRGNNLKGTCNMYRARKEPQIGLAVLRCMEELAKYNQKHIEDVRTVVNTPKDKPDTVEVTTTFKFDNEENARGFAEALVTED